MLQRPLFLIKGAETGLHYLRVLPTDLQRVGIRSTVS